jgi:hypothetical protein
VLSFLGFAFAGFWIYQKINLAKKIEITIADFKINGTLGDQSLTITFKIFNQTPISAVFSGFYGSVYDSANNKVLDLESGGSFTIPAYGYTYIPINGQAGIMNILNSVNDIINNSNQKYYLIGEAVIDGIAVPVNVDLFNLNDLKKLVQ